jgi:hypothetical protein
MIYVDYHSAKHVGTIASERYDTLAEAVAVVRIMRDQRPDAHPSIRCDEFRAIPMLDKMAARPVLKWSIGFPADGIYKGAACRRAEEAGVRYVSHRTGYVASDRAFRRFVASWDEFLAWCALPEIAAMRAANSGRIAA